MENSNNNNKYIEFFKKYLLIVSLVLLSIILMTLFRYKKMDINRLITTGKKTLAAFYSNNLQPLFVNNEISEEDVFNFAVYQSLPIDKSNNKVLHVSNEDDSSLAYEIKPAAFNPETKNYQRFADYLELNEEEKDIADSILNVYKKEIYKSVLTNDNTVAVNPKLSELQKAALADILSFAQKVNKEKAYKLFSEQIDLYKNKSVMNYISSAIEMPKDEFIFITPDTAFKAIGSVPTEKFEKEIEKLHQNNKLDYEKLKNYKYDFHFYTREDKRDKNLSDRHKDHAIKLFKPDSNLIRIVIPVPDIPELNFVKDSIRIKLDKTAAMLRNININLNGRQKDRAEHRVPRPPRPPQDDENSEFSFSFEDPTPLINQAMKILSDKKITDWEEFGHKMDSLARNYAKTFSDSTFNKSKATIYNNKLKTGSRTRVIQKDTIK